MRNPGGSVDLERRDETMKRHPRIWWTRLRTALLALLLGLNLNGQAAADAGFDAFEQGDYEAAFKAWQGPAERGKKNAQFYLGYLYDSGQGVEEDNAKAASWYRKAAVQGQSDAQYNLAAMYVNGDGVAKDYVLAYMLFDLAADRDQEALDELNDLLRYMTPLQVARGNRLARLARRGDMAALLGQAESAALSSDEGTTSASWNIWSERDRVALTQRSLVQLGYDPGPVDGDLGGKTKAAIKDFQEKSGLPVDGLVSDPLLEALFVGFDERLKEEEIPYGQGLLWKIEKGETVASHLLGTFHTNDPEVLDLPRAITRAFFRADRVALELEVYSKASYNALGAGMVDGLVIDDGRNLRQIIGRDLYSDVVAALTPYGVQEGVIQQIKPWGIYFLLNATAHDTRGGHGNALFLDLWIGQKAVHHGKPLIGLETAEEQYAVFAGLSEQDQVQLLDSAIAYSSEDGVSSEELKAFYLAGDIEALFRRSIEPARRLGPKAMLAVIKRLLDDRNAVMVERMAPLLAEGNAFIAVGAAHLPGRAGVLQMLVDQGYKVTRVH